MGFGTCTTDSELPHISWTENITPAMQKSSWNDHHLKARAKKNCGCELFRRWISLSEATSVSDVSKPMKTPELVP
jgi:hypothetical protein